MKRILKIIIIGIVITLLGLGLYVLYGDIKHKDDCCSCCSNTSEGEVCISACCRCE